MLHCHQFAHHPSVRPAKLSSLFGNSSNSSHSCILQQLNANINDALTSDGAQYWNGKRHRCIRNRIRRQFQGTSVATALQAYDLQEQIRRISFHERIEFFNLFQHQNKYFPNATNSRKRTRNLQTATTTDSTMPNYHNWLNDLSVAQISEMIRKTEKDKREKMRTETDSRESVHSAQPNGTALDYVHTTLFGPNFSGKILNAKTTRQRRHSAPSTAEDTQPSFMNSAGGFFSHFPAQSLSLVGVGGFGRVYRINGKQNAFNDERLAVKIIPFNSSKGSDHQEKTKDGRNKYGTPILSAAAMIAALHDEEEQQRALEESSTEKQVLREVSVLSALSSRNTARYRWAWVEKWSDQFDDLFNTRSNHPQRRSISTPSVSPSASISDSASFSDTSSEWSSSNSSVSSSMSEDETESESSQTELVSSSVVAGSSKPKYDSVLVLLMDYYVGISLSEFIANPSAHLPACMSHTSVLSSLFRLYLSYQILTSLEYLHGHQCIHRDLAPKNLILEIDRALLSSNACNVVDEQRMDALLVRLMSNQVSADDVQDSEEWKSICSILAAFNVRLIDFGLSRHFGKVPNKTTSVDDTTTHNNMEFSVGVGTRSYAPPEQLHRTSSCTCKQSGACNVCNFADRGDIYSCGLLLSEMLCAPFNTQMERIDFLSRMRDRRWNQMESFQTLPKLLKDLLCSMINSVPNARPSASEAKKSKAFHAVRKLLPFIAAARYEHCAA